MNVTLKAFFPEKKNRTDFINFLTKENIKYSVKDDFPEHIVNLDITEQLTKELYNKFGYYIFSEDSNKNLLDTLHEALLKTNITISGAESCTGGLVSKYLTDKDGASKYFKYSVVSYSNKSKINILNVKEDKIKEQGPVSKAVVIDMIEGLEYIYPTDISYAVSGIAGPTGAEKDKPVGTVFIGIIQYGRREIHSFLFQGNRSDIRVYSAWTVLLMIFNKIKNM